MANNPYLSRLKKNLKEQNDQTINERLAALGENATSDQVKNIFNEFNLPLPSLGRRQLTDEEKAANKAKREQKRREQKQRESEQKEKDLETLTEIYLNGTAEQKQVLLEIIAEYNKKLLIIEREKELEELKKQVSKKENELEELRAEM